MAEYTVPFTTVASTTVTVEADNYDDALDAAYNALPTGLCAQCSGWNNPPGVEIGGEWEPEYDYIEKDGVKCDGD